MIMVGCECDGLPAHDHLVGHGPDERGVWGPIWDADDVGRVWVDWKAVARAFADAEGVAPKGLPSSESSRTSIYKQGAEE